MFFRIFIILSVFPALIGCREYDSIDSSTELQLILVGYNNSEKIVPAGIPLQKQNIRERKFIDVEMELEKSWDTRSHLQSTYATQIKLTNDENICYLDTGNKIIGCYQLHDNEPSLYLGMGYGEGPSEVRRLDLFDYNPNSGSLLYDASRNMLKYLDASGVEKGKTVLATRPPIDAYVNKPYEIITLSTGYASDSPIMIHDIVTNNQRSVPIKLFPTVRDLQPDLNISAIHIGYISRLDDTHLVMASRNLGFFSLINLDRGIIWSRTNIDTDLSEVTKVYQRGDNIHEPRYYLYTLDRDNVSRSAYAVHVTKNHIIIDAIDEGRTSFDFYDTRNGDYLFSSRLEKKPTKIISTSINDTYFACLTQDGIISIFSYSVINN